LGALSALALFAIHGTGCDTATTTTVTPAAVDYTYEDPWLYDYYYPADLSYAGAYGANAWNYSTMVDATLGYSGSAATAAQRLAIGGATRSLIRGQSMCPGAATVTQKSSAPPCAGTGAATMPDGVTIAYNNCQITGGGTVSGTFDVQSNRSTSAQTCTSSTNVQLGWTTTITNLAYVSPDGGKILTPSQTDNTSMNFAFGVSPNLFSIASTSQLQFFNAAGSMLSDHTSSGTRQITLSVANQTYTIDGTVNATNNQDGATATLAGTGVVRSQGCCRPTAGTIVINRTGGLHPGQHTWTFQSSCGAATLDGAQITLPACL
jgi:hypothetical protein